MKGGDVRRGQGDREVGWLGGGEGCTSARWCIGALGRTRALGANTFARGQTVRMGKSAMEQRVRRGQNIAEGKGAQVQKALVQKGFVEKGTLMWVEGICVWSKKGQVGRGGCVEDGVGGVDICISCFLCSSALCFFFWCVFVFFVFLFFRACPVHDDVCCSSRWLLCFVLVFTFRFFRMCSVFLEFLVRLVLVTFRVSSSDDVR